MKMKKTVCIIIALMLVVLVAFGLCACGETETPNNGGTTTDQATPSDDDKTSGGEEKPSEPETPSDPTKENFTGLTLSDLTVTYDGTEHTVTLNGTVPEGANVVYENNKATNAGTYNVKATVTKENYNPLTLTAKLVVNKANIADGLITFTDETVEYDGLGHSLAIVGDVPAGCSVSYTYNGTTTGEVVDGGEYNVVATVSGINYNAREYTAKLTIKTTQKQLYSAMLGSTVYFQNPLDSDTLYKYDGTSTSSGTSLVKVNNDEANYITAAGDTLYYTSKGLLSSNIKKLTSSSSASAVYSANAEYITVSNGYVYYAVNSLLGGDKNGIYRYSLSAEEDAEATQIYTGKASWLTIYNDRVYFAAGASKGKLTSVSINGGSATEFSDSEGLLSEKNVTEMILSGSTLYLNIGTLTGGYAIFRLNLTSNTITKMTTDAGKNLTVIGDNLYYVNDDLLTSNVFGKGICKIALTASSSILPGTKLVDENVYSLTGDGSNLYYYRDENKHFMKYSLSSNTATDLMASFTPKEDNSVIGYAETKEYNNEIYYINNRDGGAIYKYNPTTKGNFKVIADACSDFWFNDGYMYYSKYVLTNYDLYKREMKTGADAVRVSKNRIDALTFSGDYIYYVDNGASANRIRKVAKTSTDFDTDAVQVSKDNVNYQALAVVGTELYYCTNPTVGYKYFYSIDASADENTAGKKIDYGETFTYLDGKFYVYNQKDKKIYSYDTATDETTDLQSNVTIVDMINDGTYVYYASNTSGKEGLYKLDVSSNTATKIHNGAVDGLGSTSKGITYVDVKITYASEMPVSGQVTGNGNLYLYNGTSATKLK